MGDTFTRALSCNYDYDDGYGSEEVYSKTFTHTRAQDNKSGGETPLPVTQAQDSNEAYSPATLARLWASEMSHAKAERKEHKKKVKRENKLMDERVKKENQKLMQEDKDFQEIMKMGEAFLQDINESLSPSAIVHTNNLMQRKVDALRVKHLYLFRTLKRTLVEASEDFLCEMTILISSFIDDDSEAEQQSAIKHPWATIEIEDMRLDADAVVRYKISTKEKEKENFKNSVQAFDRLIRVANRFDPYLLQDELRPPH